MWNFLQYLIRFFSAADYLSITREMGHIYFKCEKRQDHYEMVHLYRKQQEAEAAASGSLDSER